MTHSKADRALFDRIKAVTVILQHDHDLLERVEHLISPPNLTGQVISGAEDAAKLFQERMVGLVQEELHVLHLNRPHVLISYQVASRGNNTHTIVDPRIVLRHALEVRAQQYCPSCSQLMSLNDRGWWYCVPCELLFARP